MSYPAIGEKKTIWMAYTFNYLSCVTLINNISIYFTGRILEKKKTLPCKLFNVNDNVTYEYNDIVA